MSWADELLICDSGSTDATLEIAGRYHARVIQHEYINSARQKNWAIPQAAHEWVLIVDSDEALEPALQAEIHALLREMPEGFTGFRIPRKNLVFGEWIRSCNTYPDYNLRLFKRDVGRYADKEVHADVILETGQVGVLRHAFVHHDFEDVVKTVVKWGRYTRYEGDQLVKVGRKFRAVDIALRPPLLFLYLYFWKRGFLDGFRGFYVAAMWSMYVFLKYARLWQLEWEQSSEGIAYQHGQRP